MADLEQLLVQHHQAIVDFMAREARGLLRFESVEDLAQGLCVRALGRSEFEYRSEREFFGWLWTLARRHVADRQNYWAAMKRGAGPAMRITSSPRSTLDSRAVQVPNPTGPGPSTFAERREMWLKCAKALAALSDRDRDLVRWKGAGLSLEEQAERLGLSYEATQRAGLRAMERFQKLLTLERPGRRG